MSMLIISMLAQSGYAARLNTYQQSTYDSTSSRPVTTTARLFCYQYTMNGVPITNTVASNSPSAYDASRCTTVAYTQNMFIVGLVGGGPISVTCPTTHPYFHDRRQVWAFAGGSITAGTDAQCCQLPDYTASGTAAWVTPTTPGVCP